MARVKVNGRSLVPLPPLSTNAFKFGTSYMLCYLLWDSIKVLSSLTLFGCFKLVLCDFLDSAVHSRGTPLEVL